MSLVDAVKNLMARNNPAVVAAAAPATTAPVQDDAPVLGVPKQECPMCHTENVIIEAGPYADLPDHPQKVWRCLNPYCKQWGAVPVAE